MDPIIVDSDFLKGKLLFRQNNSYKGNYGHLLLICGCRHMPGSAVLATGAALHSGCGLVTLHSASRALDSVSVNYPSAILSEDPEDFFSELPQNMRKYNAVVVGPGLAQAPVTLSALSSLLSYCKKGKIPMVLDADALNLISFHPELFSLIPPGSILTPHFGELHRMIGWEDSSEWEKEVVGLSSRIQSYIVVKGYHTRIYSPDGKIFENPTGNPGMAKGGSGDVLSGLVGGLLSRGYSACDAALLGVWIHGYAGDSLSAKYTCEAYSSEDLIGELCKGFEALYK